MYWFCLNDQTGQREEDLEQIAAQEQKQFQFEILVAATKNFHDSTKLGEGGFGPVFKVETLPSVFWILVLKKKMLSLRPFSEFVLLSSLGKMALVLFTR